MVRNDKISLIIEFTLFLTLKLKFNNDILIFILNLINILKNRYQQVQLIKNK